MSYEPLGEEPFDGEQIPVKPRRRRKKKGSSGVGRTATVVFLVLLVIVIVAVAITVPIMLTRRTRQNAASDPNARSRKGAPAASVAPTAKPSMDVQALQDKDNDLPIPGEPAPGALVDNPEAGFGSVDPVGPNHNTGNNVFCYKSSTSGQLMEGAYVLTGEISTSDGLHRSQVQSCGSGSKMFVLTSQLELCKRPCLTPVWRAIESGAIKTPIWKQEYVCRGDQVYIRHDAPRFEFWWRYAGFVEEQLVSLCGAPMASAKYVDSWYIPNAELRFCTPKEKVDCQMAVLNSPHDQDLPPKVVKGVPSGTASNPRPVCEERNGEIRAWYATGPASNNWSWRKFYFADQMEVVPCSNHTAERKWIFVDDVTACPTGFSSACDEGRDPKQAV